MHVKHIAFVGLLSLGLIACSSGKKNTSEQVGTENPVNVPVGPGGVGFNNFITGIDPNVGPTFGGIPVTISGRNFAGTPTVTFGTAQATEVSVVNSGTLQCTLPPHPAGVVDVVVSLPSGDVGRLNNGFTYDPNIGVPARVADYGDPTPEEQELVELMQRARRDPVAEGQRLGLDFSNYSPVAPLSHNIYLARAALFHTQDMATRNFFDHADPDGVNANGRVLDSTYDLNDVFGTARNVNLTENIAAANGDFLTTPQHVHDTLMKDEGLNPPKHRNMILGVGSWKNNREVGIGYRTNLQSDGPWEHFVTQEFAYTKRNRPFLAGVVYNDADGDMVCRVGEGRSNIPVKLRQGEFEIETTTMAAGGYAFEVFARGDYEIEIEGQTITVNMQDDNKKLDFRNGAFESYGQPLN